MRVALSQINVGSLGEGQLSPLLRPRCPGVRSVHRREQLNQNKKIGMWYTIGPNEVSMAKFTELIRFALTPGLFKRIRAEAQQQEISVSELIRRAVADYGSGKL